MQKRLCWNPSICTNGIEKYLENYAYIENLNS